jgi:flagellar assembly protein FliH
MNSSRRDPRRESVPRQVPPPPGSRGGVAYTRFIPREELQGFAAWMPDAFGQAPSFSQPAQSGPASAPARPGVDDAALSMFETGAATSGAAAPSAAEAPPRDTQAALDALQAEHRAELQVQVAAARQQGYQDGYRDGLVALESFKESFATQVSGQMAQVLVSLDRELGQLEQLLAARVARVATELARQVVRSELGLRPALVVQVAQEAIDAVLTSARHITVQVHPDDHAMVVKGCAEVLAARGGRLLALATVPRGGCRIESDAGVVDARVATRWAQATQALGTGVAWEDGEAAQGTGGGDA